MRIYARRQRERYRFDSSKIARAENVYVAWIDLMGAGHLMSVSLETARQRAGSTPHGGGACNSKEDIYRDATNQRRGFHSLPAQSDIEQVVRSVMIDLSSIFISTPDPQNKVLLRGGIAFGPVYRGEAIAAGLAAGKREKHKEALSRVAFGPAIIQAYRGEGPPRHLMVSQFMNLPALSRRQQRRLSL
ncbi:hypothetical protein GR247_34980 [Rhizobium leguminosarum]|uniref:Uncharacterized protein n=3 Tax=Rhizobium TaxID=379 RepID=A0A6N9ZR69_9HYPH|nr:MULTISPECIES: hypothetical protein [Rhizobium]MBB4444086.1 hypothetical protein [Rhizobium esperanzae]MDH6206690.1 hypothetical protein [Rhizobium leguminosarum]NEH95973.1 hypothetical protein [Rhizobium laguerreae]NEJ25289.1 hypothetical protein [Rhizobium leguminosarum]NEJ81870.1 hypothetical protein [Rhizobium leguminosarum]